MCLLVRVAHEQDELGLLNDIERRRVQKQVEQYLAGRAALAA